MTTTVARRKIKLWTPKDLKDELRDVRGQLKHITKGLSPIPHSDEYVDKTSKAAQDILDDIEKFERMYAELLEQTETKRTSGIKPRLCDKRLTDFLSRQFDVRLPELGKHGICDLNSLVLRAISLYVKQFNLGNTQFFSLDDNLLKLFRSPSINDPTKTYLELGHQRISELTANRAQANAGNKDYKTPVAVAEIIEKEGNVTMNYSALKIIVSKFALDYDLTDTEKYTHDLKDFAKVLQDKHEQYEEAKKRNKKASKKSDEL